MSEVTHTPEGTVRLRGALDAVPAYKPGKPAADREGITAYKMSSNENPYPPLPSVVEVLRDAAGSVNRYPDMGVGALTAKLAESLGVPILDAERFEELLEKGLSALD